MSPYTVVRDFELELCRYTGAKYCVTTTSCTMALLLACRWHRKPEKPAINHTTPDGTHWYKDPVKNPTIRIPKFTYVGVPMSIMHAGFDVVFEDYEWAGSYHLDPLPVIDSARWLSADMISDRRVGSFMVCLSFHHTKHLGISTGGGAILHDNKEADEWLRMMRFDGRKEGVPPSEQKSWVMGYHAMMSPQAAAEGLLKLSVLPKHNDPIPADDYPDLSKLEIFK